MHQRLFSVAIITSICFCKLQALRKIRHPIMTPGGESTNSLAYNNYYFFLTPTSSFLVTPANPTTSSSIYTTTTRNPFLVSSLPIYTDKFVASTIPVAATSTSTNTHLITTYTDTSTAPASTITHNPFIVTQDYIAASTTGNDLNQSAPSTLLIPSSTSASSATTPPAATASSPVTSNGISSKDNVAICGSVSLSTPSTTSDSFSSDNTEDDTNADSFVIEAATGNSDDNASEIIIFPDDYDSSNSDDNEINDKNMSTRLNIDSDTENEQNSSVHTSDLPLDIEFPSSVTIFLNLTNPFIKIAFTTNKDKNLTIEDITQLLAWMKKINQSSRTQFSNHGEGSNYSSSSSQQTDHISETGIDLNGPNWWTNFGKTTTYPSIIQTPIMQTRLFRQKCSQYGKPLTRASFQVLIIGGTDADEKEFPHMTALGYGDPTNKQWLCGGSLISDRFVITAAHCLNAKNIGNVRYVRLGTTTLQTETLNSEDYNVIRAIAHPSFIIGKNYDDIALLELDRTVIFTDYISPICLSDRTNFANTKFVATGWGRTSVVGATSMELHKVELEYFPNYVCQNSYAGVSEKDLPQGILDVSQICAGSRNESKDTCQGDSGGPLQYQESGKYYLVGITSFGIGCGLIGTPGVYTRVSNYITWIESIVWA